MDFSWFSRACFYTHTFYTLCVCVCFAVTETPPVRGAATGALSASTVQRLQSFSCPAEAHRAGGKEEAGAQQKENGGVCDRGKGAMPPCGLKRERSNNETPKGVGEEEADVQEEPSVVSPKTQVLVVVNTVV